MNEFEKHFGSHVVVSLRTSQDKVEHILSAHPQARDNDKLLYLLYLRKFTGIMHAQTLLQFEAAILDKEVPTPETISRVRRKIQEAGHYPGTRQKDRQKEEAGVRAWAMEGKQCQQD